MYVKFYTYRHQAFSKQWWTWLIATGVALSFVMSTKYVGLFTFVTIGAAVAVDLWNLLDYRRGLPIVHPPLHSQGIDVLGTIRTSLCSSILRTYRPSVLHLLVLVLAPLCDPLEIGSRR